MVFSSILFLFVFLPLTLLVYTMCPAKILWLKNLILLLSSLVFYAWGEPKYILLMLFSILMNYFFGLWVDPKRKKAKWKLAIAVTANVLLLGIFKYLGLFSRMVSFTSGCQLDLPELALPIGISFYTFQAMSYVIDVYCEKVDSEKNLITFGAYISFFPQLIAGPIVQYKMVQKELHHRVHSSALLTEGVMRFVVGLGKKVLLANGIGQMFDAIASMGPSAFDAGLLAADTAWLAIISYMFQIYFDFSGYSDMAIGLGKMFGFHFPENFNYPYQANSISDFWRRWHMTLGGWFREYVYIPLGGNRKGVGRYLFAIFVVWSLTGLWHGAHLNFVVWGLYFGVVLLIEKKLKNYLQKLPTIGKHLYTLVLLTLSFQFFIYSDLHSGLSFFKALYFQGAAISERGLFLFREYALLLLICAIGSTELPKWAAKKMCGSSVVRQEAAKFAYVAVVMVLCIASLINSSYNPFLYFRF